MPLLRSMVFRTPPEQRSRSARRRTPWERDPSQKKELVTKLEAVEKRYDFYSGLYRQYAGDLVKLSIYVRQIVTEPTLRDYLQTHRPADLEFFDKLLAQGEGKVAM